MAVQKSKRTRSKKGMKNSCRRIKIVNISIDFITKEKYIYHRMTKKGFYKGKKIISN